MITPFKVPMQDVSKKSLQKRVNEKLAAGYTLHTPITEKSENRKVFQHTAKHGYKFKGDENIGVFFAVVVKNQ